MIPLNSNQIPKHNQSNLVNSSATVQSISGNLQYFPGLNRAMVNINNSRLAYLKTFIDTKYNPSGCKHAPFLASDSFYFKSPLTPAKRDVEDNSKVNRFNIVVIERKISNSFYRREWIVDFNHSTAMWKWILATLYRWGNNKKYFSPKVKFANLILQDNTSPARYLICKKNPIPKHLQSKKIDAESFLEFIKEYRKIPEEIKVDNDNVQLAGLMEMLARSNLLMHKIDLDNLEFIIERTVTGKKIARPLKINFSDDEIKAFSESNNTSTSNQGDSLNFQVSISHENITIEWESLSIGQKQDYLLALFSYEQELKDRELIDYLIWRDGYISRASNAYNLLNNVSKLMKTYENEFAKNNLQIVEKSLDSSSFCKYCGEGQDNIICGKGIAIWSKGNKYEGNFIKNKIHGHGTMTFRKGDRQGCPIKKIRMTK